MRLQHWLIVFFLCSPAMVLANGTLQVVESTQPVPMLDVTKGVASTSIDMGSILLRDDADRIVDNPDPGDTLTAQVWFVIRSSTQSTIPALVEIFLNGQSLCRGEVSVGTNSLFGVNCGGGFSVPTSFLQIEVQVSCRGEFANVCSGNTEREYELFEDDPIDHQVARVFFTDGNGNEIDRPGPGQPVSPAMQVVIQQEVVYYFAYAMELNGQLINGCSGFFPFDEGPGPLRANIRCPVTITFPDAAQVELTGFVDPADETMETNERNNSVTRLYTNDSTPPPTMVGGITLEQLILPDQPPAGARYGQVVAIDDGLMACGVPGFTETGVALYRNSPDGRIFDGFLLPPSDVVTQNFGSSGSFEDDLLVVGAPASATVQAKGNSLQALLFERAGTGLSFKQPITATSGRQPDDQFGASIAVSADTLVVGAPQDDEGETTGQGSGAIYVFANDGGNFTQIAKIKPSNPAPGLGFGSAVAIDDDQIAAAGAGNVNAAIAGSAEVFQLVGENLSQIAAVSGDAGDPDEMFGASIDIDNGTMLVGAPGSDAAGTDAGAVYQFDIDGEPGGKMSMLTADDAEEGAQFGAQVKMAGLEALVGAPGATGANGTTGAVYRYLNNQLRERLSALSGDTPEATQEGFGAAIDLEEGAAVFGAPGTNGARGGATSVTGLTKAERRLEPTLPVDSSFACPGFYRSRVVRRDGATGRWSQRLQLLGTTSAPRLCQGGLVFGGGFGNVDFPGFSAYNIRNTGNEPQRLIGEMQVAAPAGLNYRVEVVRREGGDQTVIFGQDGSGPELSFETTIDPGFHTVRIYSTNTASGTDSGTFLLNLSTRFVDRPGGGFFGSAIVGGQMVEKSSFDTDTGFVGFCIAEERDVEITSFGVTNFGDDGIDSLGLSVLDRSQNVLFADPE